MLNVDFLNEIQFIRRFLTDWLFDLLKMPFELQLLRHIAWNEMINDNESIVGEDVEGDSRSIL
jgi:hypothetical protein